VKPTGIVVPEAVTVGRSEQIDPDPGLYVVASDKSGVRTRFLDVTRAKNPVGGRFLCISGARKRDVGSESPSEQ
jgi:hypothetical protein